AALNANVIMDVVEADVPITEEDRRVTTMALKSRKPVVLAINKIDKNPKAVIDEWRKLGIKQIIPTSTTQRLGKDELFQEVVKYLPPAKIKQDDFRIRV